MDLWKTKLNADPISWLLDSNPWTRYRTMTDLLEVDSSNPDLLKSRADLLQHEQVQKLVKEVQDWITIAPTRNNDSKISYFKLRMLADFGIRHDDLEISEVVDK